MDCIFLFCMQWKMKMRQKEFCFPMGMVLMFLQQRKGDWNKGEKNLHNFSIQAKLNENIFII